MARFGAVEAGGTKFVCAVGTEPDDLETVRIPTTTPQETLERVIAFFRERGPLAAVGVGSFGRIDGMPSSPTWGYITTTPKPGWAHTNVAGTLRAALGVPVGFDTDVNAAALGECRWGAGRGLDVVLYLTVGTGIGGGCVVYGRTLHGLVHPEMGHIRVVRAPEDSFAGICPYHRDCLEGLACGPALEARWGRPAQELPPDHPAWDLEADYLAQAIVCFLYTLSPERIVLGGGVMAQRHLFPRIHRRVRSLVNRYLAHPAVDEKIDELIVPPALGDRSGVLGALALAQSAAESS